MNINIGGILATSVVNGEGIRTVIFSTGCTHNCDGCHNQHLADFNSGTSLEVNYIYDKIRSNSRVTKKRVTFSGGDPFFQAKAFCELAEKLKSEGYNIWCYSGYTLEELQNSKDEYKIKLLNTIDVLVDGKFKKDLTNGALEYTGSSNQRIIHLAK